MHSLCEDSTVLPIPPNLRLPKKENNVMGRHIIDHCSLRRTICALMRLPNGRRLRLNTGVSLPQSSRGIPCCTCFWDGQQFAFLHTTLSVDVGIADESDG
jgi:hypothetical protein